MGTEVLRGELDASATHGGAFMGGGDLMGTDSLTAGADESDT